MSYAPPHFSWVTEHVAGFAFPALRENLDYLVNKAHITHLITLCREKPEHIEDFPSLHHHYHPVGGFTEDDLDLVKEIVDIMVDAESKNEKSGVHCQMGMVRTGTILAAYLANKNKVDGITATKQLGKLRRKSLVEGTDAEVVRLYAESLGYS
ncbi:unnamed protein product [Dibothriocephalus latus]|uniref:Tyrosine specific protein phosphatases domain-containing protein n=1 Tax=Dibothriocephalus latus TaxID=60516 RepID=A0A3P7N151_DIBLA|nr:unnamed protein product [Dibothriocephalus latus]